MVRKRRRLSFAFHIHGLGNHISGLSLYIYINTVLPYDLVFLFPEFPQCHFRHFAVHAT